MTTFDAQAGRDLPDGPMQPSDQFTSHGDDLAGGLEGLASMIAGTLDLAELLARVAGFATEAIPGVTGAGVSLLRAAPGRRRIEAVGATADVVREIDRIQYELLDEGPCLSCIATGRPSVSGSVGSDERWPRFGGRVARLGVHSALSLPLLVPGRVVGAINAYALERDVFTEHAVRLGEQFAGPAAVAVHNAQLLSATKAKAEQLQTALGSRAIIDQAIGVVRSRSGGSADDAFARLRAISQSENVKLADVAGRIVDEAVRRAHARQGRDPQP